MEYINVNSNVYEMSNLVTVNKFNTFQIFD